MVWWIDLAIVLVALVTLVATAVSVWGDGRRLLREVAAVREVLENARH